jgi:hypothetical protein
MACAVSMRGSTTCTIVQHSCGALFVTCQSLMHAGMRSRRDGHGLVRCCSRTTLSVLRALPPAGPTTMKSAIGRGRTIHCARR